MHFQLMDWFQTKDQCQRWGGPQFGFPFTVESFLADSHFDTLSSHVLVDRDSVVLAFGQYYGRLGRCHFGRLAVRPGMRRQGLGQLLIGGLARHVGIVRSVSALEYNHGTDRPDKCGPV